MRTFLNNQIVHTLDRAECGGKGLERGYPGICNGIAHIIAGGQILVLHADHSSGQQGIVQADGHISVPVVLHHSAQGHLELEGGIFSQHEGAQVVLIGGEHRALVEVPDIIVIT